MANILSFESVYKSIIGLPQITLPHFVVLTGRNGSGKTHLLEAVAQGKVRSSLVNDVKTDVQLFDWNTLVPKDTGRFDPSQDYMNRGQIYVHLRNAQNNAFPQVQQIAMQLGIPAQHCSSIRRLLDMDMELMTDLFSNQEKADQVYRQLQAQLERKGREIHTQVRRQASDNNWAMAASKVAENNPMQFWAMSESSFFDDDMFLWGQIDAFQQAFGRVFTMYRELVHSNALLEKYPPENEPDKRFLATDEFERRYGPPPWEFVNHILERCSLDFRVDHPPMHERTAYEPRLMKLSTDVEMGFQDLSSGEKILMSFALCLYNAEETRHEKVFPKLLLLDEVDAPLHPLMVVSLINIIQDVLVEGRGVSVILTTHSPSTVALAPEVAIYEMDPTGPRICKIGQGAALSLLTAGVPTLSVSFDGRRQVFVESRTDARLYDCLYQRYKNHLDVERSLIFLEVGHSTASGGEQNAGCDQVVRLVNGLVDGGNESVLGLIDWDGKNTPTERIHVLCPDRRDGLESLLLDPVLLTAALVRENIEFCLHRGIVDSGDRYTDLGTWDMGKWQRAINVVQQMVLDRTTDGDPTFQVEYLGGMTLEVSQTYMHLDDHELEGKVVGTFGFLKPRNDRAGGLLTYIANVVVPDFPDLLPKELLDTFEALLRVEI